MSTTENGINAWKEQDVIDVPFYDKNICIADNPHCTCRSDKKNVIFKKLEKVGEPYMSNGHLMQTLSGEKQPNSIRDYKTRMCYYANCILRIEIKQNKEDMEEKKLNFKPFDLEAAKAGKPVCTRDGRKARIICFDAKRKDGKNIMALIPSKEYPGFEDLVAYPNNGNYHGGHENDGDLMMLPEKKEGWVNIYNRNRPRTSSENCYIMTGVSVFETKEGAISYIDKDKEYIDTVKIEWEE